MHREGGPLRLHDVKRLDVRARGADERVVVVSVQLRKRRRLPLPCGLNPDHLSWATLVSLLSSHACTHSFSHADLFQQGPGTDSKTLRWSLLAASGLQPWVAARLSPQDSMGRGNSLSAGVMRDRRDAL